MAAAIRALRKEATKKLDEEVVKKNRLLRQNHSLQKENKQHLRTTAALRERLDKAEAAVRETRFQLQERKDQQDELRTTTAKLQEWTFWFERVKERAALFEAPNFLKRLGWLGRKRPTAKDRCTGYCN